MRKLRRLFSVPLLLLGIIVNAQTRTVKGKVLSAQDNQPLSRASVVVKGRSAGTTTDNDGSFSLNVPAGNVTLVISSVGFTENEIAVANGETTVTAQLLPSSVQLNEVVVTALGVTKNKKTLNYATQTVETKDLSKARETNIGNSLAGRVSGLDVVR